MTPHTPEPLPPAAAPPVEDRAGFPLVGIGASAGGFEAFSQLLQHLPGQSGMAFVLVQHLDPTHASSLVDLLARAAKLPVHQVTDGTLVEVDHVYVIPPNTNMVIRDGTLYLTPRSEARGQHMPIDLFFQSLARERTNLAIGVILSGTGSDGTLGLKAFKAEGGITFAQDNSAKYDGMPRSAIAAGCVDFVLPPEEIAGRLLGIGQHPYINHQREPAGTAGPDDREEILLRLFTLVRKATGVDFAPYRRGTILRRIHRRMVLHQLEHLEDYLQYVQDHAAEARTLFEDMLIHVTSFFREPETFEALKTTVFPALVQDRVADASLRLWVPGCSSGEEVYSLAVALVEFLGDQAAETPIKIFATDISDSAIDKARAGKYLETIAADVSAERLRRFFTPQEGGYQINKTIRDLCVFARQDVTRDPPFSSVDLISCRNVLIYLGPVLQKRVLPIFHYALKDSGFLLLGNSETIGLFSDLFTVVDGKHHIYARKVGTNRVLYDFALAERLPSETSAAARAGQHALSGLDLQREADRLVLTHYAPAGVVVNQELEILQSRGQTGPYLELAPGLASLNLLKMAREGLLLPLRDAVEEAKQRGLSVRREGIHVKSDGPTRLVHLVVTPFSVLPAKQQFFLILFEEATAARESRIEDRGSRIAQEGEATCDPRSSILDPRSSDEVARLHDELSATRNYLQAMIEELEASNEELKAANEEIVSSNEELRSTNEELQTAKEELQATNEELNTVNEELRHRHRDAIELSDDLSNLLSSVQIPIVMLGQDQRIRRFTPSAAKLLNLIPTDVGRPLSDIQPRLDIPNLEALIAAVIDTFASKESEVQDRDGHWQHLSIRPYRTLDNKIDGAVLTLVDVDALKRSEQRISDAEARLRAVVDTAAEGILTFDDQGKILSINQAAQQMFGYDASEAIGKNIDALIPASQSRGRRKDGSTFPLELAVNAVQGQRLFMGIVRDVTELQRAHERALQTERLAAIGQLSAGLAHESRNALQRSQACLEMLAREVADRPSAMDRIARLQQAQNHLLRLYEEVRGYAAPLKLHQQRCHLGKLLQEVWSHLEANRKGRAVTLRAEEGAVDLHCEVDAVQIEQVFRNILENALQACSDPVDIEVVWSSTALDGQPALAIALRNNGPPFTPEERQRLFEAFFTTKTHGTGLGMTIVKRIVEAHGGRIEVGADSVGQGGAGILIALPRGKS